MDHTGVTWTDDKGANIMDPSNPIWRKIVATHPAANPFKNQGWAHLEKMRQIMPATVRGHNVFRPSQGVSGLNSDVLDHLAQTFEDSDGTPDAAPDPTQSIDDIGPSDSSEPTGDSNGQIPAVCS